MTGGAPGAMPNESPVQLVSGRHVIAGMIVLGLVGAVGSWSFYRRLQRRPIDLWGPRHAERIVRAPRAMALWLGPARQATAEETFSVGGGRLVVLARKEASGARGLSHIRHGLVNDTSFDWSEPLGDCRPKWEYALQFADAEGKSTLLVALNCRRALLAETGANVSIRPVASAIQSFLREQFAGSANRPETAGRGP